MKQKQEKISIIYRYDDVHAYSRNEPEQVILDCFRNNNIRCVMAVIPFVCAANWRDPNFQEKIPLPKEKIDFIKPYLKAGVCEIALHGLSHQNLRRKNRISHFFPGNRNKNRFSEFYGQNHDQQLKRLIQGKEYLESLFETEITSFVPPWNSYDKTTIRCLDELGFEVLSGENDRSCTSGGNINILSANARINDLQNLIENQTEKPSCLIIQAHAFDFKKIDLKQGQIHYQEFEELIKKIAQHPKLMFTTLKTFASHNKQEKRQ
ncbi:MAG: DUF2334 domain-containing protein [Candidatus Omnitrophica bacterium]|nr:DUF2334 domain-containing protein [Candidatus Omnitrophota bacterium]